MKAVITAIIVLSIGCVLIFGYCINRDCISHKKEPVYVEYFKQGQILFPDYACPDTLIVRDATGLNKAMAYVEQDISWGSDADCDSLIHGYCDYANSK